MRMAFHHHDTPSKHPIRTLLFAVLVIILALLVSAVSLWQTPLPPQSDDASIIRLVAQDVINGEEVFNRVCSTCHAIDRPTDTEIEPLAPPMRMVARRYLMATESAEAANARIIDWLKGPDAEKSLMPPMAIEHHGLMPPVVLTEEERVAVASFVVTLAEESGQGMMKGEMEGKMDHQGMMQGEGQGMMMHKKQNGDMNAMMQQRMQMKGEGQMKGCNHDKGEGQMKGCNHEMGEGQMKGCNHEMGEGQMQGCNHDMGEGQMKGCKHNSDQSDDS